MDLSRLINGAPQRRDPAAVAAEIIGTDASDEASCVLRCFQHFLKRGEVAEIRVPDRGIALEAKVLLGIDIEDVLYHSPAGPVSMHDVIDGFSAEIERSGVDLCANKCGVRPVATLERAGFERTIATANAAAFENRALAFKRAPTEVQRRVSGL